MLVLCAVLRLGAKGQAVQTSTQASKLALDTTPLPTAALRHAYRFQFTTHGGTPPVKWEVVRGGLPADMRLDEDGLLSGTPRAPGEYRCTIAVTDSSRPPQTVNRELVLRVIPPLLLEWKEYAKVAGRSIAGRVEVSNSTEDDFDFTVIVLAVNEIGKAFAIGYQHFPLKGGEESMVIPFGDTLPQGAYVVHVDAVGEVPSKDAIYRARLQTKEQLPVTVGP
jgi:hypothetical protein